MTMVAVSTKKRKCRSKAAVYKQKERNFHEWTSHLHVLRTNSEKLPPHNGKIYTFSENVMLIRAIVGSLERRINEKTNISWTSIDTEIGQTFHVSRDHITWLRELFLYHGTIVPQEVSKSGRFCDGSSPNEKKKLHPCAIQEISNYVCNVHSRGGTVNATKVNGMLMDKYGFSVHRTTISRLLSRLGFTWTPMKFKPRTFAAHRHEALRNFLIKLDAYVKELRNGNERELVFVFTDESFIHQNHKKSKSYLSSKEKKTELIKERKAKDVD